MEEVKSQGESTWNKKKIFITVFLLALLIAGGYFFKTSVFSDNSSQVKKSVKGISAQEKNPESEFKLNVQEAVKEKIASLKQQVSSLNISEIASSSPQVQKILNDIKSLEQYPVNQAKELCKKLVENFCGL